MDSSVNGVGTSLVLCGSCGKDYSTSDKPGGFIWGKIAVGPCCADETANKLLLFNEHHEIEACPAHVSFKQWAIQARQKLNNTAVPSD
jgi:hypothetical protein